jgi:N-acetyl-anhydromuramyl-L-alanine amidase AmpD
MLIKKLIDNLKSLFSKYTQLKEGLDNLTIVDKKETKNYTGSHLDSPPTRHPTQIVVHYSAGEIHGMGHVLDWINNPDSKVSYHYIIGYDGTIYQLVDDKYEAWHAGSTSTPKFDDNALSLGVALESHPQEYTPKYTKAQLNSCTLLLAHLCREWDIPPTYPEWGWEYHKGDEDWKNYEGIMGHESINRHKGDPGDNFPYKSIIKKVSKLVNL